MIFCCTLWIYWGFYSLRKHIVRIQDKFIAEDIFHKGTPPDANFMLCIRGCPLPYFIVILCSVISAPPPTWKIYLKSSQNHAAGPLCPCCLHVDKTLPSPCRCHLPTGAGSVFHVSDCLYCNSEGGIKQFISAASTAQESGNCKQKKYAAVSAASNDRPTWRCKCRRRNGSAVPPLAYVWTLFSTYLLSTWNLARTVAVSRVSVRAHRGLFALMFHISFSIESSRDLLFQSTASERRMRRTVLWRYLFPHLLYYKKAKSTNLAYL